MQNALKLPGSLIPESKKQWFTFLAVIALAVVVAFVGPKLFSGSSGPSSTPQSLQATSQQGSSTSQNPQIRLSEYSALEAKPLPTPHSLPQIAFNSNDPKPNVSIEEALYGKNPWNSIVLVHQESAQLLWGKEAPLTKLLVSEEDQWAVDGWLNCLGQLSRQGKYAEGMTLSMQNTAGDFNRQIVKDTAAARSKITIEETGAVIWTGMVVVWDFQLNHWRVQRWSTECN